ncbi:MAG: enoyl-CoA hydratase-related protein [Thermaurantiacus sp.]|uniref:enoyl-CoA hydratase-related protein n=1 Tax=Thermaurantiacus sp. TaxID=2820283 RepID=UPI00298F0529|nr:enoyl-CoA hydratase-related protein [Thermaurantiacus sp.]MDW8414421.1 enoyl-CoA hydratase-related protein [Thermaurantiacus sp.]
MRASMVERGATLEVEVEGPILWVRLDRPVVLNAYNATMGAELAQAFDRADTDDGIRVVVLTARGRVFCAGADMSAGSGAFDLTQGAGAGNFGTPGANQGDFLAAIMRCRKPSIVAFNGPAVGVGLTMTLPCDIRIAAEGARFGCVFTRRGLVPEAGSAWFLPRLVGLPTALRWCLTGAMVPADEALVHGLVSEVVPAEALADRARALALEIATHTSALAVGLTRHLLWRFSADPDPSGALAHDTRLNVALGRTAEVHEGVAAFLEKRPPRFPGRVSADWPAEAPPVPGPSARRA